MDNRNLFAAIGGVEEKYLLELEETKVRRLPRRFGLIAAIFALLLTACAAPAILQHFDALRNGGVVVTEDSVTWSDLWKNPEAHFVSGNVLVLTPSTVAMDITVAETVPESLEQQYLPLALLDYCEAEDYTADETHLSLELSVKVPEYGWIRGVYYQQHLLPETGHIELDNFLGTGMWDETMKTYGTVTALEIDGRVSFRLLDPDTSSGGVTYSGLIYCKNIFWSDGHYLFCLKLPITYNLPITALEEIITSLTPVEDISEYLPKES